jgi:hypothetical protein
MVALNTHTAIGRVVLLPKTFEIEAVHTNGVRHAMCCDVP